MTRTVTGSAGANFQITVNDTASDTGTNDILYQMPAAVRSVTFTDDSLSIAYDGTIGTSAMTLILSAINNITGGSDVMHIQTPNPPLVIASLLVFALYNEHATQTIAIEPGASNPFFPASEKITVQPGACVLLAYSDGITVTASSNDRIKLTGSGNGTSCKIFLLGN